MVNIIGIRFKKMGKMYYFDPCGMTIDVGEGVIVETARGIEYGDVVLGNTDVSKENIVEPLKKVLRIATEEDKEVVRENAQHAKEAFNICKDKIEKHELDMHLVTVECTFDLNKILFYFTADGRVDFRDLVRDLATIFRTRIELRQIGVRDEAKMIGGLGACGRELCCSSYLDDFHPVSINMAKEQNLSLNPAKISGTCGRLMCCLKYEHDVYTELQKITPRQGSYVETENGNGTIVSVQMLRGLCKVQLENSTEAPLTYDCKDIKVLKHNKARQQTVPTEVLHLEDNAPQKPKNDQRRGQRPQGNKNNEPAQNNYEPKRRPNKRPAKPKNQSNQ